MAFVILINPFSGKDLKCHALGYTVEEIIFNHRIAFMRTL